MARKKRKTTQVAKDGAPNAAPKHNPFRDAEPELRALTAAAEALAATPTSAAATGNLPGKPTGKLTGTTTDESTSGATKDAPPAEMDDFALAMTGVRSLSPGSGRVAAPRQTAKSRDVATETAAQAASEATFDLLFATLSRPSWSAERGDPALNDLERGLWSAESELDLHGYTEERATRRLRSFLGEARQRRWRCVRVIHGQGNRSEGDPVLRGACRATLQRQAGVVQAWCEALPGNGGSGATLVLIRLQ